MVSVVSRSPEHTRSIGSRLAPLLRPGDVVSLGGDLGAGKTCLTQGIAAGLGVEDLVTSPTFVILREYEGRLPLVHLDVYRFERLGELTDLGAEEVFRPDAVAVVEWGHRVEALLPKGHLRVELGYHAEGRAISFDGRGDWVERIPAVSRAARVEEPPQAEPA